MNILGINSFFEHPSVALVCDGELVFAMEDERITRIKHGKSYTPYKTFIPYDTIYCALKSKDLTYQDIDVVAFSYNRWLHLRSLLGCFTGRRLSTFKEELIAFRSLRNLWPAISSGFEVPKRYQDRMIPGSIKHIPYKEWAHHLSHAASAFYCSGFHEALIVVADGSGEQACTSIYLGIGKHLKKIFQILLPHSLGFFYAWVTEYLGFEPFSDEYKVMGLAAYGEDRYKNQMQELVQANNRGGYRVNIKKLLHLEQIFGSKRNYGSQLEQKHKDIARSCQSKLEEVLENIVRYFMHETGMKQLCLAGGTFLNILANARIAQLPSVNSLFIQPAAHDAGTAIGAAALSWVHSGGSPQLSYPSMFLGTQYTNKEIEISLERAGVHYKQLNEAEIVSQLAAILSAEKTVALYRGRMEFGPRALGHRSLLASPKSKRTREKLNKLKVREDFRPLAPLVPIEDFNKYFIGIPNRYMMLTVTVRSEVKETMPAIVHHDGTARTQVIFKEHDPFLHALLKQFERHTGIPVLINTSLNVRGKPIDESPYDALASFFTSGIDYICLDNFIVENPYVS